MTTQESSFFESCQITVPDDKPEFNFEQQNSLMCTCNCRQSSLNGLFLHETSLNDHKNTVP